MKNSIIISIIIFLSKLNDHFQPISVLTKNKINIHYDMKLELEVNSTLKYNITKFTNIFNLYGLKVNFINIENIKYFNVIESEENFTEINEPCFLFLTKSDLLLNIVNYITKSSFKRNEIIIFIHNKDTNLLSLKNINKLKANNNCIIVLMSDENNFDKIIIENYKSRKKEYRYINKSIFYFKEIINYKSYRPLLKLINFTILVITIIIGIYYNYRIIKLQNVYKIPIYSYIGKLFVYIAFIIILILNEIDDTELIIFYNYYSYKFYIVKMLLTIFLTILKTSIIYITYLINEGYSIIFFDKYYKNSINKKIIIVLALDFFCQGVIAFFENKNIFKTKFINDLYNMIYYFLAMIYLHFKSKIITTMMMLIKYLIDFNFIRNRSQNDLQEIQYCNNIKLILRAKTSISFYFFCIWLIVMHLIYQNISKKLVGSIVYDFTILITYFITTFFISLQFKPKIISQFFNLSFQDLISNVPNKFLKQFSFNINNYEYLNKYNINSIDSISIPIIIVNPYINISTDLNAINNSFDEQTEITSIIGHMILNGKIGFKSE